MNLGNASALGNAANTFDIEATTTFDNTSGSTLTLANNYAQIWGASFTFTGSHDLNLGSGAVSLTYSPQVTVTANNLTVGGVISGTGKSLTKAGSGTLTLSGANTYDGGTHL